MNKCRICGELYAGEVCEKCLHKAMDKLAKIFGVRLYHNQLSVMIQINEFIDMVGKIEPMVDRPVYEIKGY
jgi:hypothetical protein